MLLAVKAYDNPTALPLIAPMLGPDSSVLTLQNGVDSAQEVARVAGEVRVIGGTTYIATALTAPGVIDQTGTHRRIVFGEVFGELPQVVRARSCRPRGARQRRHSVGRRRRRPGSDLGEVHLPRDAGGFYRRLAAARSDRSGQDTGIRAQFLDGCREVERVARAEGVQVSRDVIDRIASYVDGIPGTMRSSLLIDLSQGKRIEVEALHGAVVRRAAAAGVPVPIMSTLYALLKPFAAGQRPPA